MPWRIFRIVFWKKKKSLDYSEVILIKNNKYKQQQKQTKITTNEEKKKTSKKDKPYNLPGVTLIEDRFACSCRNTWCVYNTYTYTQLD